MYMNCFASNLSLTTMATGRRIKLDGPDVRLPVTLAVLVGLAFHELATNAAKYGALSDLAGMLEVNWAVGGEGERYASYKMG